jgi:hypothetical protein
MSKQWRVVWTLLAVLLLSGLTWLVMPLSYGIVD